MVDRVVVIGGGIAGMGAAYAIAEARTDAQVTLVEMEAQLAHHTTGRSAAQLIENYGAPGVRRLTLDSLPFFRDPPAGLVDRPLLTPRGLLSVGGAGDDAALDQTMAEGLAMGTTVIDLDGGGARKHCPALRPEWVTRGVLEPEAPDIDVAGLHQAFVRGFRRADGAIAVSTRVDSATVDGAGWQVETTTGSLRADVLVNAAGAWGDVVARRCGVVPVGLIPKQRTAFMTNSSDAGSGGWPLVASAGHRWYFKPDGVQLLCSPADERAVEPGDARHREIDVALGIDRINEATTLGIRSVASAWAGLRTFTEDREMVIGPDQDRPTFIWCVGQGGTGIQTAPAAAQLTAQAIN